MNNKKYKWNMLVVLLIGVLLTGCGIPQEDYDKVVGDLAAAQTTIHGLDTDLASATERVAILEGELADHKETIDYVEDEYYSLKSEYEEFVADAEAFRAEYVEQDAVVQEYADDLMKANDYLELINVLYTPAFTVDGLSDQVIIDSVKNFVDKTGDEALSTLYDTWSQTPSNRNLASEILVHCFEMVEELLFS